MKYANMLGYSDIEPFEVVKVISDKTLEIRPMNAVRDESVKLEFAVGGYSAHCINQHDQRWFIASDDTARTFRIRLRKNGTWKDPYNRTFDLSDEPVKFYDYNF